MLSPTGHPSSAHALSVRHRVEHYVLEVRFEAGTQPAGCHAYAQTDLYTPKRRITDLAVNPYGNIHLASPALTTGVYGIEWSW